MTLLRFGILLLTLFLGTATAVTAQELEQEHTQTRYWVHYTQGFSTMGAGSAVGLSVDYSRHVFSIRTSATDRIPGNGTWDVGMMYGRSVFLGSMYVSGGVGFSVIAGEQYSGLIGGNADGTMEPMLAFPVEGHLSFPLTRFAAIGVYSFLNINTNQPFGGVGAAIRIGRVK